MVGGLGEEADPHDERDRVGERRAARTSSRSRRRHATTRAAPRARPRSRRRGAAAYDPSAPFNSSGARWATLARCRSTSPTPKPPPSVELDRAAGLTLRWADGTESHFGLEELRRNCPCAECRGLREQGQVVGPKPRSLHPAHRDRRRARRRLGPHDPLERRPRDRDLRLEHPARVAGTRARTGE